MTHTTAPPSRHKITPPLISVFSCAALLAALQLELFTALGERSLTGEELGAVMGVKARRLFPVLNALVLLGLLRVHSGCYESLPYDRWRQTEPEDTVRFHALRLRELGMIKSSPQKIIADGTDWRFLNELKKELKA